jgi:hypothetical protein
MLLFRDTQSLIYLSHESAQLSNYQGVTQNILGSIKDTKKSLQYKNSSVENITYVKVK